MLELQINQVVKIVVTLLVLQCTKFPIDSNVCEKWTKFVQRHRRDFRPASKDTSLCPAHFEDGCYHRTVEIEGFKMARVLKKEAVPIRDTVAPTRYDTNLSVRGFKSHGARFIALSFHVLRRKNP